MGKWHSKEEKEHIVHKYIFDKTSVIEISTQTNIPQSTIYDWIKEYIDRNELESVAPRYSQSTFEGKLQRCEDIVTILKTVNCTSTAPLRDKLYEMEKLYPRFTIHALCNAMDVPRGTFYNHLLRNKKSDTKYARNREKLRKLISTEFEKSKQRYGPRKITAVLRDNGIQTSEETVRRLMRELNLYSICQTTKYTYNKERTRESPRNIIQRNFYPEKPNEIWASDVTYFHCTNKTYYICVVMDLFSRKIVAYKLSLKNNTALVNATVRLAYIDRHPERELILHTDRGANYLSRAFNEKLRDYHIKHSYSEPGTPHDNAAIESFFNILKREELYRIKYRSENDLKTSLSEYIRFYNTERPHSAINHKSPEAFERNYNNKKVEEQGS